MTSNRRLGQLALVVFEGFAGFLATDGDELLGFVVVEGAVAAHLDIDEDVGMGELRHEEGVLANHDGADTREHGIVGDTHLLRPVVMTADIDAHQEVAFLPLHTVQGDGVGDAAVDEDHAVALHGFVEGGQGDGGTDGFEEAAVAHDDFVTGLPVGGDGTIGDGQLLDGHVGHEFHDGLDDTRAFDEVVETEGEVGKLQHLPAVHSLHPFAEILELASGIDAGNECAHGTAGDGGDVIALCQEFLDGTDMGEASGTAT